MVFQTNTRRSPEIHARTPSLHTQPFTSCMSEHIIRVAGTHEDENVRLFERASRQTRLATGTDILYLVEQR